MLKQTLIFLSVICFCTPCLTANTQNVILNGLEVTIDEYTGSITRLAYPAVGTILQATSESAGLLTVSYPVPQFVAMQLGSQFSQARIIKEKDQVVITWDRLSPSRKNISLPKGDVVAEVRIKAAPDGRSVILSCHIDNGSQGQIPQVLFPDFAGFRPYDKAENMELRLAMGVVNPFAAPVHQSHRAPFYPIVLWEQYPPSGMYHMNTLRWMDFGSLKGGLSVFQKKWLTDPRPAILTHRDEADPHFLRLAWQHTTPIPPGQSWDSGEFWLTPHRGGWAKGIEVFRDYVNIVNPPREIPVKIKEGLGFQTVWMMQGTEIDANQAAFRYRDLLAVAQDAKNCGIDNIVPWGWCQYGHLPIKLKPQLGTIEELTANIKKAKSMGIDISPFINVKNLGDSLAKKYGLTPGSAASWTYHPELIPAMFPFSAPSGQIDVPTNNLIWQEDVKEALRELVDAGITCFCWDVFQDTGDMSLVDFIKGVRKEIRIKDPQASFGGEPTDITLSSLERAAQVIDYTWNWQEYLEAGPILNVLKYPRINCNIENSPMVVKMAFADGLYINAMPKKPNQPNGTKLISQEQALFAALKDAAALRKQFLTYFTDGIFIGESVLATPVCEFVRTPKGNQTGGATFNAGCFEYPSLFVRGHQLGNKLLIIVLNNDIQGREVKIESDLDLWLPAAKHYNIKTYSDRGKLLNTKVWKSGSHWAAKTKKLKALELTLFEIETQK